jgi:alkaline phosphatase D
MPIPPLTPDFTRRHVVQAGAGLALAAAAPAAFADPVFGADQAVKRVAFGACAHQDKDQPIWDVVLATKPDLFVFLGDNIYGDTRDPEVIKAKYAKLAAKPGFKRLRETVPILAVWDDHDYGENDIGAEYPRKEESRKIFCDFWGEAADSARRARPDGLYQSYVFGPAGRRVQILLPDLRWNRTPLISTSKSWSRYAAWAVQRRLRGLPVPGPYLKNEDPGATILGETQWRWLEEQLAAPADIRLFGSSIQVLSRGTGWETWENFGADQQRLFTTLDRANVANLVCLSGDVHYGELTKLDRPNAQPLWELTSSGLTQVMPVLPPNERRVGTAWRDRNFGLIDIYWTSPRPRVVLQVYDEKGAVRLSQSVTLGA